MPDKSRKERKRKAAVKLPPLRPGEAQWDGRAIRCALCGASAIASQRSARDWRCLQADSRYYYLCPLHFPRQCADRKEFARAYARVFARLGLQVGPETEFFVQETEQ